MGWTLLHLMTAFYPEEATEQDQKDFETFLYLL
jgi:hypothetical protein